MFKAPEVPSISHNKTIKPLTVENQLKRLILSSGLCGWIRFEWQHSKATSQIQLNSDSNIIKTRSVNGGM